MDFPRFRECLDADFRRMRDLVANADPAAQVPSCPDWTVDDLAKHTATVYLHKAACTELGKSPTDWPPDLSQQTPAGALDDAYAKLTQVFDAHQPADPSFTWFDDDQTVGFWIRRMAQETVIHRRDAELVANAPTPADDELALDGIAELLDIFVAWPTQKWAHEIKEILEPADGDSFLVDAGPTTWLATIHTDGVVVTRPTDAPDAAVRVSGSASALLFWLWNRPAPSDGAVTVDGDQAAIDRMRALLTASTQ